MAEFKDVMKQWRRFCKSHSNCGECEFDGKGICGDAHMSDVPYSDMELRIMAWAAEHPEPVYPTWFEVLEKFGVAGIINGEPYYDSMDREIYLKQPAFTPKAFDPIPADIAEKLGVKPKE